MSVTRTLLRSRRRSLLVSVAAITMLSLGSNVFAAVLCPHMSGSDEVCATGGIGDHAQTDTPVAVVTESEKEADSEHCAHHADAEAASDVPDSDKAESADTPVPATTAITESITAPADECSHCVMHSQRDPAGFLRVTIQNSSAQESAAIVAASVPVKSLPANYSFLDIHDHGPPGASNARYLLINIFRI